jgi:hypothetical protein
MSTLDVKPNKVKMLNSKLLPIAAILLLVLALLFVATPLLRGFGISGRSGFNRPTNGQFVPRNGTGTPAPGGQNGFSGQGNGSQGQGFSGQGNSTNTGRTFANQPGSSLLRLSFLNGITGTIVYAVLLLVALAAAVGMFIAKRWGQILGIFMAVVYLLLALVSFLPMILLGFARALNGLTLGLDILRLVLAIAVIVLAVIPAKKALTPPMPVTPVIPPAASA